jgi:nitroreductase
MSVVEKPVTRSEKHGEAGADPLDQIILNRFACRDFTDRPVTRRMIEDILDVARFAPSGANIQPWQVYVLAGQEKERISSALVKAHREARDQHASEYKYYSTELPEPYLSRRARFGRLFYGSLGIQQSDAEARANQTAKNYSFFGAQIGLIVTIDRRLEVGSWLDLGMFIQNVLLAARARGLETCPQETFSKYHRLLRAMLPIPPEQMVVCGISIGWARDEARRSQRLMPRADVAEFASFVGFD